MESANFSYLISAFLLANSNSIYLFRIDCIVFLLFPNILLLVFSVGGSSFVFIYGNYDINHGLGRIITFNQKLYRKLSISHDIPLLRMSVF